VLVAILALAAPALEQAEALYRRTEYRDALAKLNPDQSRDAGVLALAGRIWFGLDDYKKSAEFLDRALALDPKNARYAHWLGKAHGRRAETSSLFTAAKWASECRKAFERAVELDPKYVDAWTDVFQYYLYAPGIMGGGIEKAERAAARLGALDPAWKHWSLALLAEKRQDFPAAERHYREAVRADPKPAGRMADLAAFLAKRGRAAESDAEFARALQLDPANAGVKLARARALVDSKRNPGEARRLLEEYLKLALTPDDPPRREAAELLRRL
jgi:tetratricopeptide (TPR) repeat protein